MRIVSLIPAESLDLLATQVAARLSERRFAHTLGVRDTALLLGARLLPGLCNELAAAALLHDITKECSREQQVELCRAQKIRLGADVSPEILHALTAPAVIRRDFPAFATSRILSAARNHTTGRAGMSLFDKIIFLSDYIEPTRPYPTSRALSTALISHLGEDRKANIRLLDGAVLRAVDQTLMHLCREHRTVSLPSVSLHNDLTARGVVPLSLTET